MTAGLAVRGIQGTSVIDADSALAPWWGKRLMAVIAVAWLIGFLVDLQTAMVSLMVCGFALAIVGVRRPLPGVFGIAMLCTLNDVATPLALSNVSFWRWNTLNYWMLIVIFIFLPALLQLRYRSMYLLLALAAWLAVGLFPSPDPFFGTSMVLEFATPVALLIYISRVRRIRYVWPWVGMVVGLLTAMGSFVYTVQLAELPTLNANVWAYFPATGVFATVVGILVTDQLRLRNGLSTLAILNGLWVFLSGSRGTMLVVLACLVILVLAVDFRQKMLIATIAGLVILTAVTQFTDATDQASNRVIFLLSGDESTRVRTSGRSDLAKGAIQIFLDHPLGAGTGGFPTSWAALGYYRRDLRFMRGEAFGAHGGWFLVLAENGLPGILLLGGYVASFFALARRHRNRNIRLIGSLVAVVLALGFLSINLFIKGVWLLTACGTVLIEGTNDPRAAPGAMAENLTE